nr:hypothetical protein [uncultured Cohaesibacter sp.]
MKSKNTYRGIEHKLNSLPDFSVFDKRKFLSAIAKGKLEQEKVHAIENFVDFLVQCECIESKKTSNNTDFQLSNESSFMQFLNETLSKNKSAA